MSKCLYIQICHLLKIDLFLPLWVAEPSKMTGLIERKKKTLNKRGPSLERKKRQGDPAEELAAGMLSKNVNWYRCNVTVAFKYSLSHCNSKVYVLKCEVISRCLRSPVNW